MIENAWRFTRHKLIVPLKRSPHPPEYSARGVAVGLFWAFTPLVGIQMYLCLMTWLAMKRFRRLDFSLILAFAWTWVSNVFTMVPIYYGFYVTGQVMRGSWDDLSGYDSFADTFRASFSEGAGFWHGVTELGGLLVAELGLSMSLGCVPYAVVAAWIGYVAARRFIINRNLARIARRRRARAEGVD